MKNKKFVHWPDYSLHSLIHLYTLITVGNNIIFCFCSVTNAKSCLLSWAASPGREVVPDSKVFSDTSLLYAHCTILIWSSDLAAPLTLVTWGQWCSADVWTPHHAEMVETTLNFKLSQEACLTTKRLLQHQVFSANNFQISHSLIKDVICAFRDNCLGSAEA